MKVKQIKSVILPFKDVQIKIRGQEGILHTYLPRYGKTLGKGGERSRAGVLKSQIGSTSKNVQK